MDQHILRTKLQRPAVAADTVPRQRLLSRLDEWRGRTLTLSCRIGA